MQKPRIDRNYTYPDGIMAPWAFGITVLGLSYYDWQGEVLEAYGQGLPSALCAANGSGKTQIVITTALLWFLYSFPKGIAPTTSGSWTQLSEQMWPSIERFKHKFPQWTWLTRRIETQEGGALILFSTRESGLAEGYHGNWDENRPCSYVIDEAKTVGEGIFTASDRCTVQFKMLASSPGESAGRFFSAFNRLSSFYYTKRITSFDCAHISEYKRNSDREKYGENSPTYRSMHLGEFADDEGPGVIIARHVLARCIQNPPSHRPGKRCGFCDFGAGTDENVFALCDGNRVEIIDAWIDDDTMQACYHFIEIFQRLGLLAHEVSGDNGGLGKSMIDRFEELGWYIYRVDFGGKARNEKTYASRSTEIWFESIREIEKCELILPDDQVFFDQATTRRREYDGKGRLLAEPKKKMALRGLNSPDRADAVFGALWARRQGSIATMDDLRGIYIPNTPFINDAVDFTMEPEDEFKFGR